MKWIVFLAEQRAPAITPYSAEHFILLLGIIITAFLFACLFRHSPIPKSRLCCITGILLAVSEIGKQLVLTEYLGRYSWMDFPFQLCSMPMYLCLLYPICKKRRKCFEVFFSTFGLLGGLAALAEPSSCFTEVPFLTWHALFWHGILLFLGFYFIPLNKKGNFKKPAGLYFLFAIIAILINVLLTRPSGASVNMFFLGPNYPGIVGLITIWQRAGWLAESAAMMAATVGGAFLIFITGLAIYRKN